MYLSFTCEALNGITILVYLNGPLTNRGCKVIVYVLVFPLGCTSYSGNSNIQWKFLTKDEHKVEHRTILTQGIYMHLRN